MPETDDIINRIKDFDPNQDFSFMSLSRLAQATAMIAKSLHLTILGIKGLITTVNQQGEKIAELEDRIATLEPNTMEHPPADTSWIEMEGTRR
jgi:hypothetical protein